MPQSNFTINIIKAIRSIPLGKVCTYGQIAEIAGNSRAARQVSRMLHVYGEKEKLPWHRVVNKEGRISIKTPEGFCRQKSLLSQEGILFDRNDRIDMKKYRWEPDKEWLYKSGIVL